MGTYKGYIQLTLEITANSQEKATAKLESLVDGVTDAVRFALEQQLDVKGVKLVDTRRTYGVREKPNTQ